MEHNGSFLRLIKRAGLLWASRQWDTGYYILFVDYLKHKIFGELDADDQNKGKMQKITFLDFYLSNTLFRCVGADYVTYFRFWA